MEMGIDAPLWHAFHFRYRAELDHHLVEHEFDHVFIGEFEGEPVPNEAEVCAWRWVEEGGLLADLRERPERYTHWFRLAVPRVITRRREVEGVAVGP
jgi:isopentenyl-diphosphate delta-isomerase